MDVERLFDEKLSEMVDVRFSFLLLLLLLLPKKLNRLLLPDDLTVPLLMMERGRSLMLSLERMEHAEDGVARGSRSWLSSP